MIQYIRNTYVLIPFIIANYILCERPSNAKISLCTGQRRYDSMRAGIVAHFNAGKQNRKENKDWICACRRHIPTNLTAEKRQKSLVKFYK